ncbi:hypothetical protein GUJ93_ZPchr0001g32865 [Zizania palustris]|uniref:Uncharacterized protein n=1 Tax=Zizania palustris TaxID=103762 RepID=A0A8J5VQ17_ZIZPA|nr:hypothetical protein GUJ93_ZPchr0001g32865 [Zizania palustris]
MEASSVPVMTFEAHDERGSKSAMLREQKLSVGNIIELSPSSIASGTCGRSNCHAGAPLCLGFMAPDISGLL